MGDMVEKDLPRIRQLFCHRRSRFGKIGSIRPAIPGFAKKAALGLRFALWRCRRLAKRSQHRSRGKSIAGKQSAADEPVSTAGNGLLDRRALLGAAAMVLRTGRSISRTRAG